MPVCQEILANSKHLCNCSRKGGFTLKRLITVTILIASLLAVLTACGSGGGANSTTTYTVTYSGNGNTGGSVPNDTTDYVQGQTVAVLGNAGNLVYTGYSFAGWNTQADGSGTTYAQAQTFTMGTANVTLYAKWTASPTYTVTYSGNGNTGGSVPVDSTNYEQGQTVTVFGNTGNLVKTNYSFVGWNTQADGSGTTYTQGQTFTIGSGMTSAQVRIFAMASANVTLYAMWTANPTYTVIYNGNGSAGGSAPVDTTNYELGQTVTVLGNTGNLVNTGYSFAGWNTQTNGTGTTYTQGQTFTMGSANVTLYAKWTANATYTVTYNGNSNTGGSVPIDSTNYEQGQTVAVLGNTGNLVKTNFTFAGWNTQVDGSGTTYSQTQTFTMGSVNVTLYAKWTANPTYTVTYSGNGNTGGSVPVDSTNYEQGQTITVLGNTSNLVKANFIFAGWNTQADGSGTTYAQAQTFTMSTANVTLYAKWTASPTYTITYSGNGNTGGSVPVDSNNYEQGQTVTVFGNTGALVNTGYTFAGWNTLADGSGTTYSASQTFAMGSANSTLYAMWTAKGLGFVYSVNQSSYILQYTIGANGALTTMTTATVMMSGQSPQSLTVNPAETYAYVVNGYGNIYQYTIGSNGSLTYLTTLVTTTSPINMTIDPSGQYAYVMNDHTISQYTIGANGSLTPMTPATVGAGTYPGSTITIDPSGKYAYVASTNTYISQYTIGATGALTPMTPATVEAGGVVSITIDPSGKYAYAGNQYDYTVHQFTIGVTGALSPMTPATVATGLGPLSVTVDPSGKYAYVPNLYGGVYQYTIGATGALTPMTPATVTTGLSPRSIKFDSSGKYAYVPNASSGNISQYSIDVNGALTPLSPSTVAAGASPASVTTAL
jgi:uncharacterized repeat protein (TIGR02543 family)